MSWTNDGKAISDPVAYQQDQAYHHNKAADERKKMACDSNSCRLEWGGACFTGEADKCQYWFEREIAAQERKREGDR
jgi:hypothetical protein